MSSYYLAASHDNMSCVSDSTANVDVRPTAAMKTCSEEPQGQVGETFPFQAYGDDLHGTTQASGDLEDEEQSPQTPPGPAFPSYSQQHQSAAMAVSESNVTSDRRYLCLNATEFRSDSRASSQQTDDLSDVPSASASGGSSPDVATAEMVVSPLAAGFAETDDLFIMRPSFSGLFRILSFTMNCYCFHLGNHTTVPVIHLFPLILF